MLRFSAGDASPTLEESLERQAVACLLTCSPTMPFHHHLAGRTLARDERGRGLDRRRALGLNRNGLGEFVSCSLRGESEEPKLKLSRFLVVVPRHPDATLYTLFSTLTRAVIQVPARLFESIGENDSSPQRLDVQLLRNAGIVLDDEIDEERLYRFWSCRNRYRGSELSLTLVMTYGCNCVCEYCYEVGCARESSVSAWLGTQAYGFFDGLRNTWRSVRSVVLIFASMAASRC